MAILVKTIGVALPLYSLLFVVKIVELWFRAIFYPQVFSAIFLALVSILVFLLVPATKNAPRDKLPWYDAVLCLATLPPVIYISVNYADIIMVWKSWATPTEIGLFIILLVVIFEAVRRTVGMPVLILAVIFFLHAKFAYLLPGLLGSVPLDMPQLAAYMYLYDTGIFGFATELAGTVILLFVTFGFFLNQAGGSRFFIDLALAIAGRLRGGPAKVAIISSALFGTISGSPAANVGVTGAITIPLMKNLGYKNHFAAAVETVASSGGVLTPPVMAATAFVMSDMLRIPYGAICIAAIFPAVLYYICLYFQLDFEAAKLKLAGLPSDRIPSLSKTLKNGWQFMLPLILLAVLLMVFEYDALESIMYAMILVVVISWFRKETRMGPKSILNALAGGSRAIIMIAPICALVGIIMGSVSLTGLGLNLSVLLTDIAAGRLWLLAIMAGVAIYIMGMGIAILITYILMAILVAPAMVDLGVPMLAAHMFIFYMGVSMFFTPPLCPAVYVAASIAGSNMWRTAFQAMKLGIVCYLIPFVLIFKPALLLIGSPVNIVIAIITSILGAFFLAIGVEGYFLTDCKWWQRVLFLAAGISLFIPGWQTDVVGIGIVILLLLYQRKARLNL